MKTTEQSVHYLEIVTPDPDAVRRLHEACHGVIAIYEAGGVQHGVWEVR